MNLGDRIELEGLHSGAAGQAQPYAGNSKGNPIVTRVSTRLNDRLTCCNQNLRTIASDLEIALNSITYEGNSAPSPANNYAETAPSPDSSLDYQMVLMAQLEDHVMKLRQLADRAGLI